MIPTSGIAKLSKSLISITGKDAAKFLNGLVTSRFLPNIIKKNQYTISDVEFKHMNLNKIINLRENWGLMHEDIFDPDNEILVRRDGLNSMFLNSKGRVLSDCFLYCTPFGALSTHIEPAYLAEIERSVATKLTMVLKMHKLTAEVNLKAADYSSYYYYNDTLEFDEFLDHLQVKYFNTLTPRDALENAHKFLEDGAVINPEMKDNLIGIAIDNRIPNFGLKLVTKQPISGDFFTSDFTSKFPVEQVSEDVISKRRYLNGLYESTDSPPNYNLLPFDMNLDFINGLSLDKGCYVGQELTIRTFNSGVIRKRIVPVQFFELNEQNLQTLTEDLELIEDDEVLEHLSKVNISNITKLDVTPLQDEPKEAAPSPFGNSPFGAASKPRKVTVGKLLTIKDNLGFMLVNLKDIEKRVFKVEIPDFNTPKMIGIKVVKPNWWPED